MGMAAHRFIIGLTWSLMREAAQLAVSLERDLANMRSSQNVRFAAVNRKLPWSVQTDANNPSETSNLIASELRLGAFSLLLAGANC